MSEKIKLGLTRNRLFEFNNCVYFTGQFREKFDLARCEKALKLLFLKEPLLGCKVELQDNGDAFLVTESVEPYLEILEGDITDIVEAKKVFGLFFVERLFSFAVINEDTFAVFAHTLVADIRALSYLAMEFLELYKSENLSVEPSEIMVFSDSSQLLSNVYSVVIDRLASGLEVGWQKKIKHFSFYDCQKARVDYFDENLKKNIMRWDIQEEYSVKVNSFCQCEKIDVSSVFAYAFYEALTEILPGNKKFKKMNIQANERPFFDNFRNMQVGPFNGIVTVALKKRKQDTENHKERVVDFHKEIYKKITTAFSVFYNEVLFMRLSGSFCDSQYMYCAHKFYHKYSKRLANTYGCANLVAGEFSSLNFTQEYWKGLSDFNNIMVSEPLKMRSSCLITFIKDFSGCTILFEYDENKISRETAGKISDRAKSILMKII